MNVTWLMSNKHKFLSLVVVAFIMFELGTPIWKDVFGSYQGLPMIELCGLSGDL